MSPTQWLATNELVQDDGEMVFEDGISRFCPKHSTILEAGRRGHLSAVVLDHWPTSKVKAELISGVMVFQGRFEQDELAAAERTYPGRRAVLNVDGGLEVRPYGPGTPVPPVRPQPGGVGAGPAVRSDAR